MINKTKVFQVESKVENLDLINDYLAHLEEELDLPPNISYAIEVCFEEIFVNICNYAYGDEIGMIDITINTNDNEIIIKLADSGIPYDPLKKEDPNIGAPIEERQIGGLGIFLIKKMMDNFEYSYEDGKNVNVLEKNFD